jgi:protein-tyrosine phosphatase
MTGIVIHAVQVGEGILAISPLPGRDGDYGQDLEHIREWAPAFVVTLVTRAELMEAGAEHLGTHLQERGARWVHLPIEDYGVPDARLQKEWLEASKLLRTALRGGGRVLVHCKGGCGRSGMMALRLMIEAGEAPEEALARLRAVRPCAVETQAQMDWAVSANIPLFRHSE